MRIAKLDFGCVVIEGRFASLFAFKPRLSCLPLKELLVCLASILNGLFGDVVGILI